MLSKPVKNTVIIVVGALFLFLLMKYVFMWQLLYKNSKIMDMKGNTAIKTEIISAIRVNHSKLYSSNKDSHPVKGIFVVIKPDFMHTLEQVSENEYIAKAQLICPEDWCYYFTITVVDGEYEISSLQIDA